MQIAVQLIESHVLNEVKGILVCNLNVFRAPECLRPFLVLLY